MISSWDNPAGSFNVILHFSTLKKSSKGNKANMKIQTPPYKDRRLHTEELINW